MPNEISNRVRIIDENNVSPVSLSSIAEIFNLTDDELNDGGVLDELNARPLTFSEIIDAMDGDGDPTDTDLDADDLTMSEKVMFYSSFASPINEDTMTNIIDNIDAGLEPDDYHGSGGSGGFPEGYEGDVDDNFINSLIDDDVSEGSTDN